jgi:hypothetical protein
MRATCCLYSASCGGLGVFQNKLVGFRALVRNGRNVELLSRSGRSMADQYPDIIRAAQAVPGSAVLDAELVVLDERGHAMFERPAGGRSCAWSGPSWQRRTRNRPCCACSTSWRWAAATFARSPSCNGRNGTKLMPSGPGLYLVPGSYYAGGTGTASLMQQRPTATLLVRRNDRNAKISNAAVPAPSPRWRVGAAAVDSPPHGAGFASNIRTLQSDVPRFSTE